MSLPVDEMLLDLREALEAFDDNPCCDTFDRIMDETRRIENACEDLMIEMEEEA